MKVAFIGLGNMGSGMASNIAKSDHDLTVWNRTASKMDPLVALGAAAAKTTIEAVTDAEVVVTSLMDDKSILSNLQGVNGFLSGMKPGSVHMCVTTISPDLADELQKIHEDHGTEFVLCPVLGRPDASAAGDLIALPAGSKAAVAIATPVIETYTKMIAPIGEKPSHASVMKLCLNYFTISNIELMGEIYACAEKSGLDLEALNFFFQGMFAQPVFQMYAGKVKDRKFSDGGFSMTGGLKDIQLMLATAKAGGTRFEIGEIIEGKMHEALASGHKDLDWSAIYEVTRRRAGLDHIEPKA